MTFPQVEQMALFDSAANTVIVPFQACATGLAYQWYETPVIGTEALTIYADNEFHLPAAPWASKVELSHVA